MNRYLKKGLDCFRSLCLLFFRRTKPSQSEESIQNTFQYLKSQGVETELGNVELVGKPIINCTDGGRIIIGKNVTLVSDSTYNVAGINHPVILVADGPGAVIRISDGVGISGASIVTCSTIEIGEHVMIGANCNIYGTDFHCMDTDRRLAQKSMQEAPSAPIVIEDKCWLASNVTVLKGVRIGRESVIGAMSLVNKDIPSHSIAAGVPAHVIRKNNQ